MSDDPDEIRPGANRLAALDPENLLRITVDEISPLLRREYAALERRSGELEDRAAQWITAHQVPGTMLPVISDDNDLAKLSDFLIQLRDHAGMNGEVDTARKKVKEQPYRAALAIDAHFNNLSRPLATWIEQATGWQKDYLRRQRAAEAGRQQAEAQRMRDIAAAELAAARKAATPEAQVRAIEAEQAADEARDRTFDSPAQPIRVRSTIGSTTSGGTVWDFEVTNLRELCAAIGRGDVPVTFIQPNDQAIRAAIRGKPPLRTCSGVRIFEDISIRRRG